MHDFMADGGLEATALLHIAAEYDARAAAEHIIGQFKSADDNEFRMNDKLAIIACQMADAKIAREMADTDQNSELYSFKVPVSCLNNYSNFLLKPSLES
jgi:hypothetical protein